jgi:adenosylcobinamide kinase/adenosylcobinamide-phosphate guanylyltransferase
MIFILGGNSQGKLDFARSLLRFPAENVTDGENCGLTEAFDKPVLNKLHLLIKRLLESGTDPWETIRAGIERNPDMTIICDELSCGVVPVGKEERELQEKVGRIQCEIAKRAEKVYRVFCSLPVLLKGKEDEA